MKQLQSVSLMFVLALLLTGCASMHNGVDNIESSVRHKCRAQIAWNQWSWCYDELTHPFHFAKGFKAGYRDVLEGGNGCQPTLPDRCYWKSCYQSAEGRCKVNEWFDGFSHGALAAQQDGAGNWNQIPLSPTARMNLQMANARPQATGRGLHGIPTPTPGSVPPAPAALPLVIANEPDPPTIDLNEAPLRIDSEEQLPLPHE